jgi:hypothetical protein
MNEEATRRDLQLDHQLSRRHLDNDHTEIPGQPAGAAAIEVVGGEHGQHFFF